MFNPEPAPHPPQIHVFLSDRIAATGDRLTPTERRIAEVVLGDPSRLAFGSVSDLAEQAGTSRPSIVRFATKLGFTGYTELQERMRREMTDGLPRPSQRIRRDADRARGRQPGRGQQELLEAVTAAFSALGNGQLRRLAAPIARAQRVWIITGETSRAGAHALLSGLSMVRPGAHLVEEHTAARDLASATGKDCAIAIDFARYRNHAIGVAEAMTGQGVPLVAITDGPLSPLAACAEVWCGLRIPGVGPFDSSVPAVLVAEQLVAEVAHTLKARARGRVDEIEAAWGEMGTFRAP